MLAAMRARFLVLALAGLTGCPSPPPVEVPDAPFVYPDVPVDAGPAEVWTESENTTAAIAARVHAARS